MKRTFVALLLCCTTFALVFFEPGCRKPMPPEPPNGEPQAAVTLVAVEVGITHATLRLTVATDATQRRVILVRDATALIELPEAPADTVVTDTTLFRGQTYTYRAYRYAGEIRIDSSDAVVVTALDQSTITLELLDVVVRESALRITLIDLNPPRTVHLMRDGSTIRSLTVAGRDTVVLDTTLTGGSAYSYRAFRYSETTSIDSTAPLQVTTLTPTSQNFSFVLDTLGDGNSSVLYDVAIVSTNPPLVYVVGDINVRDSAGNWEPPYGLAIWDGNAWELRRLYYVNSSGGQSLLFNIRGIQFVNQSEIWFAAGSIFRWDGVSPNAHLSFSRLTLPDPGATIEKLWGNAHAGIYGVGNRGTIVYYDGMAWGRIESGTTVSINDIWGVVDPVTGKRTILAAASNAAQPGEKKILSISPQNSIDTIAWPLQRELQTTWFASSHRVFVAADGAFVRRGDGIWRETQGLPDLFQERIRGQSPVDYFVVGHFGLVAHWNGISFRTYPEAAAALYYSCDFRDDLLVAVGGRNARAVVVRGIRN